MGERQSSALLLFGATGDLARRKLLPSLYALHSEGLLPENFRILGTARSEMAQDEYRALVGDSIRSNLDPDRVEPSALDAFLEILSYRAVDISTPEGFDTLGDELAEHAESLAIFLSTAPHLFEPAIEGLSRAGLAHDGVRICLEKPLGDSLQASRAINDAVSAAFPEQRIFRIDHYLGKETVQNLLALRFANLVFEPLWNAAHVDHVQITVAEEVGLDGRGDYYDGAGALRDMVQNHMLQLLALIAMEPPSNLDPDSVRDGKVQALRSLRAIDCGDSVIGQYRGYDEELGQASDTETHVALKAHVDNWRWAGTPFYLRTGKKLSQRNTEIVIRFKCVPHSIFGEREQPNELVISIQPDENIHLSVMAKVPGLDEEGVQLRKVPLDITMPGAFAGPERRIAYERLLHDLVRGNQTLFVRRDEVEAQWRWIDEVRACWARNGLKPEPYEAASGGPDGARALIERDQREWRD